ncbi:hypothetical protein BOW53_02645 [Solemya pervernicosa gill symbiont]|uniref:NAD kinase n=2 Tax=Gammaproteobacteria incertae sedis TaxID=118884 RepID=A0A1T2L9Q0_9GAMM|nr:NAD(+) kinase [Candidatus Reidiella endopervernicosa]OOZ41752.1 hypothetical protein BOW53_02645 [Solemya pervernicosa gill symbiont]QKQ26461.1 NAD(+) kinase [Candidatus Reidiella endopervernicosa]
MSTPFKTIGLIGKFDDPSIAGTLHALSEHLLEQRQQLLLDENTAKLLPELNLESASRDEIGRRCELAIVVGGDGTLLNAARSLCEHEIAILGINMGRLGFLVDVSPAEMVARLDEILGGNYLDEERFLLEMYVEGVDGSCRPFNALNDVVVHNPEVARMIEFSTYIDGSFVTTQRADGLIVATPTGSTAYALSSGGPIMHPSLDTVVMVPICPHTLSNRPLMVNAASRIEVVVNETSSSHSQVSCDGQVTVDLKSDDRIIIQRKEKRLHLIHPQGYDYFEILRAKLGWNEHPGKQCPEV